MDALAQLQRPQNANKSLTMAERERLKQFNVFSKAVTSSMPSRMASRKTPPTYKRLTQDKSNQVFGTNPSQ